MFVQQSIAFLKPLENTYSIETYLAYPSCEEDRPEQDIWIQTL